MAADVQMEQKEQEEYMLLWRHCVGVMRSLKSKLRLTPKQCPLCGSTEHLEEPVKKYLTITGHRNGS